MTDNDKRKVRKVIQLSELEAHTKNGWIVIEKIETQIAQIGPSTVRDIDSNGASYHTAIETTHVLTVALIIVEMQADLVSVEDQLKKLTTEHAVLKGTAQTSKLDLEHMTNYREGAQSKFEEEQKMRFKAQNSERTHKHIRDKLTEALGIERINEILGIKKEETDETTPE